VSLRQERKKTWRGKEEFSPALTNYESIFWKLNSMLEIQESWADKFERGFLNHLFGTERFFSVLC